MEKGKATFNVLVKDFNQIVGVDFMPSSEYKNQTIALLNYCQNNIYSEQTRRNNCINSINQKFELNKSRIKSLIDFAAKQKIYFNYHEKKELKVFFDTNNQKGFNEWVNSKIEAPYRSSCIEFFNPIPPKDSINILKEQLRDQEHCDDILHALFSSYVFHSFDKEQVFDFFSGLEKQKKNYYEFLHTNFSEKLKRGQTLSFLVINNALIESCKDINEFKDSVCTYIAEEYNQLSNHCYLAILIDIKGEDKNLKWELFSDITLYAEKFIEEKLKIGYFHPDKIQAQTKQYISNLNTKSADFSIANGGFTYHDCFILTEHEFKDSKKEKAYDDYALLLMFEKNERDETPIPCPACRSLNVRGNSYPIIGVKSWECNNILCPDKSKYNRGKRYSLSSLIKQEAIFYEANEIKNGSIKQWQLDLLTKPDNDEILKFLVKHYTLVNDNIKITNYQSQGQLFGRNITYSAFRKTSDNKLGLFFESAYFKRFELVNDKLCRENKVNLEDISPYPNHQIYKGDSSRVLRLIPKESVDGAVTSPPYYNAKEYSQWDNIYCYLYDMYNNAIAVYDSLKPGASYLFNIFDYFDNENNIVFSAMGKKRMILGAYIIHIFNKVGFKLIKNVIWYKGHIQGNRSFNQGNTFPYYQAPLNCYEHIFHFIKPTQNECLQLPDVVYYKPVHKTINGQNVLGHTAPFPIDIPNLLIKKLGANKIVLDPYSGSFTTTKAAMLADVSSVGIEYDDNYCNLGIRLLSQNSLFGD